MLFFLNKYLRRTREREGTEQRHGKEEEERRQGKMVMVMPSCAGDSSDACIPGCFPAPFLSSAAPRTTYHQTTTRASRSNFAATTVSTLFPNTHFTNHESLPRFPDAFSSFLSAYPQYAETERVDRIRDHEYPHLGCHTCLDYTGLSLFSHAQLHSSIPSSSSPPPSSRSQPPLFSISYRSASLRSLVQYGNPDTALESAMRKRLLRFLNISEEDYSMVCTANRTSAFKLLAESYSFHSNKRLLTVYDYESEAVSAMAESAQKRGAKVLSASFSWASLRIKTAKLKKMVSKKKKKNRGMFVFPLQSRMTGARYPYLWMSLAQENGWHIVLDACALGPKDMDTLGLSLIQPDFIICSFFKVFGENPSGFAGLFIKKSSISVLEGSTIARSIGIVSIVPAKTTPQLSGDFSGAESDVQQYKSGLEEEDVELTSSFSGPLPAQLILSNGSAHFENGLGEIPVDSKQKQVEKLEEGETSEMHGPITTEVELEVQRELSSEIVELENVDSGEEPSTLTDAGEQAESMEIECRGLDHADSLGLPLISSRLRCITNWLVNALMKLRQPQSDNGQSLVRIYGPKIRFDRGPAVAFNVFDWKGEKVEPALVQKLADRSNISLSCGFLRNICFSDKYEEEKNTVLEKRVSEITIAGNKRKEKIDVGITVLNASLGFMTNFEDAYRLWTFIAKFLDADFVEKERWRYMALNQKMIEV